MLSKSDNEHGENIASKRKGSATVIKFIYCKIDEYTIILGRNNSIVLNSVTLLSFQTVPLRK